jgi:Cu-Zn family superoxide dismutase
MKFRTPIVAAILLLSPVLRGQSVPGTAHANLSDAMGKKVGTATLTVNGGEVHITADLSGLPPGMHALHIHTVGKCDAPDFMSAGGHFNPENKKHGKDNPEGAHAGDLPNFNVAADGTAHVSLTATHVTLADGDHSLFHLGGTALVIHEKADDYRTDPTGNAGGRIACGVVQM